MMQAQRDINRIQAMILTQWLYIYLLVLKYLQYIYALSGNLIEEADEQGQVIADYIYLGSIPIARVDEWWEGIQTPSAPTGVTVTRGNEQLTVSWNANVEPVDGYKVYWGTESRNYTNSVDVGKTTTYTITGLTNGISYYIAVKAYVDLKETYYYHTDHLGTPIMMTDKNQSVVWNGEFLPFGEPFSITGTIKNNLRFPGQYYDEETGLHYNMRRTYNPLIGRYLEADPLGVRGSMNHIYVYARNNVANYVDFGGLFCEQITPWEKATAFEDPNDKGRLLRSYSEKLWKKVNEWNALPIPGKGRVAKLYCCCLWKLIGYERVSIYSKDVLYGADFKCCDDNCPERCKTEKQYKTFPLIYKEVESEESIFKTETTTVTCGTYDGYGKCTCRNP